MCGVIPSLEHKHIVWSSSEKTSSYSGTVFSTTVSGQWCLCSRYMVNKSYTWQNYYLWTMYRPPSTPQNQDGSRLQIIAWQCTPCPKKFKIATGRSILDHPLGNAPPGISVDSNILNETSQELQDGAHFFDAVDYTMIKTEQKVKYFSADS